MGKTQFQNLLSVTCVLVSVMCSGVLGSHFRGGTISWKPQGGNKVHFFFRLGWRYTAGPGCTPQLLGQYVTGLSTDYWKIQSGVGSGTNVHDVDYYCTGADVQANWEQGRDDFSYTFQNSGPFTVGYASGNWIPLSDGKGGNNWNVATTVDLRTRSDTGSPNSSPESQSKPMYHVPYNCAVHIKLPAIDPDNDRIRCRWAVGSECVSVCRALPGAVLDEETCTLSFNTTSEEGYILNGMYAVAVTIEDFPRVKMTLDGRVQKAPTDVLSSVPLQFLVETINDPCGSGPRFVTPTPEEGQVISVEEGDKVEVGLYADNKNATSGKANDITAAGPIDIKLSPVIPDVNRNNTYTTTLTWQTHTNDSGSHIVCAHANNDIGGTGAQRCFTIEVVAKGCSLSPCHNDGQCKTRNYMCVCRPGFTGQDCEVDIDDCASSPCPAGAHCVDGINTYTCAEKPPCQCK